MNGRHVSGSKNEVVEKYHIYTWCTLSPVVAPELLDEQKLKQAFLFHLRNDNFTGSTNWYDVKQNEH